ncbi:hypothetical protein GCM10008018_37180 [Paenibacillus marchantiophytorum]|uniref:Uncharacterized protein n=1 Tax=Paenibacillus marchantiophytorum TaxID=1619310 RepID=A0ABQ1EU44_9BACL|nr:hypothetical protein [Paenibacillus marchantiophytorum]GFZ87562.1 hypothetical protein GCM10008018_37180 [Paenibacillus marchantiophytorum]
MQNERQNQRSWEEELTHFSSMGNESAVVLLVTPFSGRSEALLAIIEELRLADIQLQTANGRDEDWKQTAEQQGICFVLEVGSAEPWTNLVHVWDSEEQEQSLIPLDQAIYRIEKRYPPADFT